MTLEWYLCRNFLPPPWFVHTNTLIDANDIKFSVITTRHRIPKKDWYDATIVIQDIWNPGVHFIGRDDPSYSSQAS